MKKLLTVILGLGLVLTSSCGKDKDVNHNLTVENYADVIEIRGYMNGNGESLSSLQSGQITTLKTSVIYRVDVKCLYPSHCGYSFEGVTYTQSKSFLKGVDYHE